MANFSFYARNAEGKPIKGVVEATNLDAAANELRDRQLIVLSLTEQSNEAWLDKANQLLNRVSNRDITFFARQFSVLIGATIPVVRGLRILTRQTKNPYFKRVISDVAAEVDGGQKLSQALGKYPKVFDQFFVHMVRAGETTGRLDDVFEYLATQKEKDYALTSRVRGALIYPAFILSVMVLVGIVMIVYVIPPLAEVLTQNNAEIPLATQLLLGLSDFFVNDWWLIMLLIALLTIGWFVYVRTPHGRYAVDYAKIRLPIMGALYQRIILGRFSISLSSLLASGVPLTTALGISGDVVNNTVYRDLVTKTIAEVEAGNAISSVFMRSTVVPPIVSQMMNVGEETGKLDDILEKLGNFYAEEVDASLRVMTSLIEPVIIVALGIAAFIMVLGILTPIYNATTSIA